MVLVCLVTITLRGGQNFGFNLFNNQKVTGDASAEDKWTYDPVRYWPTQGHIDFLAYAPYADGTTLNNTSIDFNVTNKAADQKDLLWANATNKTKENGTVKFQFAHALSRLGYSVKLNAAYSEATITLNKITLAGSPDGTKNAFYTKGTIDLAKPTSDANLWASPDPTDSKQKFEWFSGENKQLSDKTLSSEDAKVIKNSNNEYLFVIPQDFSKTELNSDQLYVIVEYTIQYSGGTAQPKVSYKVYKKLDKNFEQGKAYTINLTIGLTPIEFDAAVTPWDTTNGDINIDSWE